MKEEKSDLFSCGQCSSSFVTKRTLESHTKAFHPLSKVSSTDADTPDQHLSLPESHTQTQGSMPKLKRGSYGCQRCNKRFPALDELILHQKSSHSEPKIILDGPESKPTPKPRALKRPLEVKDEDDGDLRNQVKTKIKIEPNADPIVEETNDVKPFVHTNNRFYPFANVENFEITEVVKSLLISHMNAESEREKKAAAAAALEKSTSTAIVKSPVPMRGTKYESEDDEEDEFEGEGSYGATFSPENGHDVLSPLVSMDEGDNFNTGNFVCSDCGIEFPTDFQLVKHMQDHVSRPHKCRICGSRFARREHLSKHQSSVHSGIKYTCKYCSKDISRRDHLIRHLRSVHRCEIPKGLDLLSAAASSVRVSSNCPSANVTAQYDPELNLTVQSMQPKPKKVNGTKCDMCCETFTVLEELFQHQRQAHGDIRRYDCAYCSKSFKRNEHLQKHIVLHTGEKNFACQFCSKSFPRRDALQDHLRRVHGSVNPAETEQFSCDLCDRVFAQSSKLVRHRNQVHNITLAVAIANGGSLFRNQDNDGQYSTGDDGSSDTGLMDFNITKLKLPPVPGLLPINDFQFHAATTKVGKN